MRRLTEQKLPPVAEAANPRSSVARCVSRSGLSDCRLLPGSHRLTLFVVIPGASVAVFLLVPAISTDSLILRC